MGEVIVSIDQGTTGLLEDGGAVSANAMMESPAKA